MNTGSTTSAITYLDGEEGILRYRGYSIEDLAQLGPQVLVARAQHQRGHPRGGLSRVGGTTQRGDGASADSLADVVAWKLAQRLHEASYRVILIDMKLPRGDGRKVLELVRRGLRRLPAGSQLAHQDRGAGDPFAEIVGTGRVFGNRRADHEGRAVDPDQPAATATTIPQPLLAAYYQPDELDEHYQKRLQDWLSGYRRRLAAEKTGRLERTRLMNSTNPKYVLRNYLAQIAIEQATQQRDYAEIDRLLSAQLNRKRQHDLTRELGIDPGLGAFDRIP